MTTAELIERLNKQTAAKEAWCDEALIHLGRCEEHLEQFNEIKRLAQNPAKAEAGV